MANYYCEYCGEKKDSIKKLVMAGCTRPPNDLNGGKHYPSL